MQNHELSLTERCAAGIGAWFAENRIPFLSSLIMGLLAYGYAFANKLPNHDDISYLFSKGATVDSGRWGLELLRYVIPDISMPWLYGLISLLLLGISVCLIVRMLAIRRPLYQVLVAGLIVCFPSQLGTFCYMFTSSCYAVAFLLAVLSAFLAAEGDWKSLLLSALCLVLVLSIYQAYLALTASLMLLVLIRTLLDAGKENVFFATLKAGLKDLAVLIVAYLLYQLSVRLSLQICGLTFNEYSVEAQMYGPGFPSGIIVAYRMFVYNLSSRYNMLIVSRFSRILHAIGLLLGLAGIAVSQFRARCLPNALMLLFCLLLLPLSICCMYIEIYWNDVHTLVLFGFATLYLLMVLGLERLPKPVLAPCRDLLCLCLALILGINVCYANRTFTKLQLAYENAYSLSTTLVTQIRSLPGFEEDMKIAFWPSAGAYLRFASEFGTEDENAHDVRGVQNQILTGENEEDFFRRYLGARMEFLDYWEARSLAMTDPCREMPIYPAAGSMQIIDGVIFVKFGESPVESDTPYEYVSEPFG